MIDTREATTGGTRRRSMTGVMVFTVTALASLVLSPITALWALLLGALLLVTGSVASLLRWPERGVLLLSAGAGVLLGVIPYFLLAVFRA